MGILQRHPVSLDLLREHQERIDRCQGTACYQELTIVFDTDSPNKLEEAIDGKPRRNEHGEIQRSRKYKRYKQGYAPHDDTLKKVRNKAKELGRTENLAYWRDLVLWLLLEEPVRSLETIRKIMASMPHNVRKLLFHLDGIPGRSPRRGFSRKLAIKFRDMRSLDGFIALLALSREGEILEEDSKQALPARCAFEIFPLILLDNPHLYACRDELFFALKLAFWDREFHGGFCYSDYTFENMQKGLEAYARDRCARLPWTAGIIGPPIDFKKLFPHINLDDDLED